MRQLDDKTSHLLERSNHIGVQFLLTDLETARTFLEVAEVSGIEEVKSRNRKNARVVYETVLRLSSNVVPTLEEQIELDRKLDELRRRLESLGIFSL
jgi:hypothetical protein